MVKVGLLATLKAKPGKEAEVAGFLESAVALANREASTIAWFAIRVNPSTFGVFDVFPDDKGRQAHLNGAIAQALLSRAAELLSEPPKIEPIDVLGAKLPV